MQSSRAQSHFKFRFDSVDLELGRNFYIGRNLAVRPFAGLKGAWFEQSITTKYSGVIQSFDSGATTLSLPDGSATLKDHPWGVGPRVGLNSTWMFGQSDFAFLANFAGTILWEKFEPNNTSSFRASNTGSGGPVVPMGGTIKANRNDLRPVMEVFLGFDWSTCVCDDYQVGSQRVMRCNTGGIRI